MSVTVTEPTTAKRNEVHRFMSLAKAETKMLFRNKTAVFNAIFAPTLVAVLFAALGMGGGRGLGGAVVAAAAGMGVLFVVFYTIVTSVVARREQLLLKRLLTGECSRYTIWFAPAAPLLIILLIQTCLTALLVAVALNTAIVHWWILPLLVVFATFAWASLGLWQANSTKSVESAQLTTLPLMLVSMLGSGLSFPLTMLPGALATLAHLLPLTPVVDLAVLAATGIGRSGAPVVGAAVFGEVVVSLAVLTVWGLLGLRGARRFRWDPRS